MLEVTQKAMGYSPGRTRDDLEGDEILRLGLTKLVEIVEEAAKQVSEQTRLQHPEVPWKAAARCETGYSSLFRDQPRRALAHRHPGAAASRRTAEDHRGRRVAVVIVDLTCDLPDEDETGFVWTFLREARDASLIEPGAIVVAGDADAAAVAEVIDIVEKPVGPVVHLRVLPGDVEDYAALVRRALPTA